jgi:hypothetical protein
MAEDQARQRGENDGREHVATATPQINPPPSATSASPPAADQKPGYYSGRGYIASTEN